MKRVLLANSLTMPRTLVRSKRTACAYAGTSQPVFLHMGIVRLFSNLAGPAILLRLLLILICLSGTGWTGTFLNNTFTNYDPDSTTATNFRFIDSFSIAKEYDSLWLAEDAFRIDANSTKTKAPAIVSTGPESFKAFWMRRGDPESFCWRDLTVSGPAITKGAVTAPGLDGTTGPPKKTTYLIADGNKTGKFAISWWDQTNQYYLMTSHNQGLRYYSFPNAGARAGIAWGRGDTVLLAHQIGYADLYFKTFLSSNASVAAAENFLLAHTGGTQAEQIWNTSVSMDPAGNVLILWRKGLSNTLPSLMYTLLSPSHAILSTATLVADISDPPTTQNYQYPDAKAFAYDTLRFAITYFKAGEAHLCQAVFTPAGALALSNQVTLSSAGKFPTVTGNRDYIFTAWNDDAGASRRIMGRRFGISSGNISVADTTTRILSRTGIDFPRTDSTAAISSAMDTLGNIMTVFVTPDTAYGAGLSNTPVFYDSAIYISQPESIGTGGLWASATDSVRYTLCDVAPDTSLGNGAYFCPSICAGSSESAMGPWVEINNNGSLSAPLAGAKRFFRVRLRLYASNPMYSPRVDSLRVHWNVKPRKPNLDSIFFNTQKWAMAPGETLTVRARKDSLRFFFSSFDADNHQSLQWNFRQGSSLATAVGAQVSAGTYTKNYSVAAYGTSSPAVAYSAYVVDSLSWRSDPFLFYVQAFNHIPRLDVTGIADTIGLGRRDTIALSDNDFVSVQSDDTTFLRIACNDSNDAQIALALYKDGIRVDSVFGESLYVYKYPNRLAASGFTLFEIRISDPDTTIVSRVRVGVNHPPVIDSLKGPENTASRAAGRVKAQPGRTNRFIARVSEPDMDRGDSLVFRWYLNSLLLTTQNETCSVRISPGDTVLSYYVEDLAGKSDSAAFRLEYPYWNANTQAFQSSLRAFADSLSFILGGNMYDTVGITISNTGTSTMTITKVYTGQDDARWLSYRFANAYWIGESTQVSQVNAYPIAPRQSMNLTVYLRADSLRGDGVMRDTLYIETTDYINPVLRIPMQLVYNDLPFIGSFSFSFDPAMPLAKRRVAAPRFPPNAAITFRFSEALDTNTIRGGITVYSRRDSAAERSLVPIAGDYIFAPSADTVRFRPAYDRASPFYGFRPPAGLFISTDMIAVRINNTIRDRAGNALDIHKEKIRVPSADTTFVAQVDSSPFYITELDPPAGDSLALATDPIRVVFSRAIDPATVDTSVDGNTTLRVYTGYSSGTAVGYAWVRVDSNSITVKPREAFFSRDSVTVRLSARIRDRFGYSIETNGDGVSAFLYDPLDTSDALRWSFRTEATPFYIFPNPYEPSRDGRHREMGGIVFKNLNRLSENGEKLDIQILSLKGHVLFSSLRAGDDLTFAEGSSHKAPAWKWTTRNQYGTEVGSGVYYFLIKSGGAVVKKGKLIIVR